MALRFPRILWLSIGAALILTAPALAAKLYCDDQLLVLRLEGALPSPEPGPFSLYTLAIGDSGDLGPFWWTDPRVHLRLMRPLSSALFALDHALFGRFALPYHLQAFAWFAATVVLVSFLHRAFFAERTSALATLLFAIAPAHAMAINWPSARHLVIAGTFSLGALLAHTRARSLGRTSFGAFALFAVSLLAGEMALGIVGYVVAYELWGRTEAPRVRARAAAPWIGLSVAYLLAYRALGFGVRASGDYADPLREPWSYIRGLPRHVGPLLSSTFFGTPSEVSVVMPEVVPAMTVAGLVGAIAFGLLLRRAARGLDEERARAVRWLVRGAMLAVLPGLGGIVGDRVLFLPSMGMSAAMAVVLLHARSSHPHRSKPEAKAPVLVRIGVVTFGALQLAIAPLLLLGQSVTFARSSQAALEVAAKAEIPRVPGGKVYGIGITDPIIGMYLQPALALTGAEPVDVMMLSISMHDHLVRRSDDRTLDVRVVGGTLLENGFETVVRSRDAPLSVGDVVQTPNGMAVRILETHSGRPSRFSATFDRSLDDETLAILTWDGAGLFRLQVPPGVDVPVPHRPGPSGF